ncbi:MAG: tRNA (N(6)-L-threonylcarbamoyladenosine(37)-C(2))-methylthiotransferase MtaB [Caldilineaceae bacterium]
MRIYLDQVGCRLNYSEMETLAARLQAAGHQTVNQPEHAQVIVFNSCAVTADAVRGSRKRVRQLHGLNPQARIALTGCWATLQPQEAAALPGVAFVATNERKDLLHTLLEPWSAEFDDPEELTRLAPDSVPFTSVANIALETAVETRRARTRAFIKVQDGCNNKCTFCIVTVARGESRSRALAKVVAEVQQLATEGVQEVVLTGVHLGSYGRDLADRHTGDLKTLVAALLTHTAIPRLRLSSLEPWELAEGFFELWQRWPGRLCPHLHLPLQAGTDKQLRHMARRCTVNSFRELVTAARATIPDLVVTTDLITGFPGESDGDFAEGLAFVEELRFAHAHIFPYSARTGTAAANFTGHVPTAVKKERGRQLRAVIERTGETERTRFLDTVRPVLFEGTGQPLTNETGLLWTGLTDNYLRVTVVAPEGVDLHNHCLPVHLSTLQGEIIQGEL